MEADDFTHWGVREITKTTADLDAQRSVPELVDALVNGTVCPKNVTSRYEKVMCTTKIMHTNQSQAVLEEQLALSLRALRKLAAEDRLSNEDKDALTALLNNQETCFKVLLAV